LKTNNIEGNVNNQQKSNSNNNIIEKHVEKDLCLSHQENESGNGMMISKSNMENNDVITL